MLYTQELKNIESPSEEILNKAKKAVIEIKQELKQKGDMDALSIAYQQDDLKEIQEFSDFIKNNFIHTVIMGIGGSSLGAKTLTALSDNCPITFLESIDSDTVAKLYNSLNLKRTAFLTVSKSGKTIECISQTLLALKIVEEKLGRDAIAQNFFFLTEDKESPLTNLAKEFGIKTLPHHKTVGGRFSYLSNVGLIPAAIAGLNIKEIRNGAVDTLEYVLNNEDNFITQISAQESELFKKDIAENIVMSYVDKLEKLTEWYRQLWAESLGKDGYGTTPIKAMGTTDQHSQLQLYMEGPKNKFFTFLLKDKEANSLKISKSYNKGFDYLLNVTLDDIMSIEANATIEVLNRRKLPIRVFKITKLNERALSQVLMQYMLETIIVGKINGINPFGQPAVEEKKIVAEKMMKD
jgi:glucose-6-phosphate isomerase